MALYKSAFKIVKLEMSLKRQSTRELSHRQDDRVMWLKYGCLKNFPESLSTPTATFPEIFNGLLLTWRDRMNARTQFGL